MTKLQGSLPRFVTQGELSTFPLPPIHPWATELDALFAPAIASARERIPDASVTPLTIFREKQNPPEVKYLFIRKQCGTMPLHQDGVRNNLCYWPRQRATVLLYLQFEPVIGGNFVCHLPEGPKEVEPIHNRLVWFKSELPHEVLQTQCKPSNLSGRFTLRAFI